MVTSIFGTLQQPSPGQVFGVNAAGSVNSNQLLQKSLKRKLDRVQGYRVDLTPAETRQLAKLQDQIVRLEQRAGPGGLSIDQYNDRAGLYREANKILGKDYVDVEADSVLKGLIDQVDALLEPKYRGAKKERLDNLRKLEIRLYESFARGNTSSALARQIANVKSQIASLVPPRRMSELSASERREYDALVEKVNARAGADYLLGARKREKAEAIQASMARLG